MGFTHAYFPAYAFDEYSVQGNWAFARKGDGYLAITASQGFTLIKDGHYALRELRSYGHNNIWLCQMGRAALDGDFSSFQKKILALDMEYTDDLCPLPVPCEARHCPLAGKAPSCGMSRNNHSQVSSIMRIHLSYLQYPCRQMDIRYGESALRLEFGKCTPNSQEPPSILPQPDVS